MKKYLFAACLAALLIPLTASAQETATPAPATSSGNQISSMKIVEVEIQGTEYKDSIDLSMYIKAGDEVTPEDIRKDLRRIYSLGYFLDVTAARKAAKGGFKLVIKVIENPVLKEVQLIGDLKIMKKAKVKELFDLQIGKTGNYNDIRDIKEKLTKLYQGKGFALARVNILPSQVTSAKGLISSEGIMRIQINEGVIENIVVVDNKETKDHVILREIRLKPGDIFNSKIMQGDLRRVFNTNFFEDLSLKPEPGKLNKNHYIIKIKVEEKSTGSVNLGAGFNNRDGLIGTFSIQKNNLNGEGQRLGVDLQFGVNVFSLFNNQGINPNSNLSSFQQAQRTLLGRIDFYDPWMFEGRTSFGASLFSERVPLFFGNGATNITKLNLGTGIIQSRVGTRLSIGRPLFGDLTSPWRGNLSFRAEQVAVTDLSRKPRIDLSVSKRFSAKDVFFSVGGNISYDTRDVIMNPKSGWYGLFSVEPIWGDSSYLKASGNLSTYLGVTDWLTFAFGVRGGSFLGENPPYEQFYSNGFNVIRGYPENGFLFGKQFVIGSVEARFPIFDPVSGVVFTDMGEFFPVQAERATLNQGLPFKYGVGLGIRLNTPMGPLRLDYGVRDFSKLSFNTLFDAGQIHFSIGQKF